MTDGSDDGSDGESDPVDRVAALHEALRSTEELPIDREANLWLGEAQAVAADADEADLPDPVVRERIGEVGDLLDRINGTGNPTADERVAEARRLVEEILASGDGGG